MRIEATPRNRAGELALEIYRRTLEWARGDHLVLGQVWLDGDSLNVDDLQYELGDYDRLIVAGAGKASAAMAKGLEAVLGDRIDQGLIVTKYGHGEVLSRCQVLEAGHPIPDANSLVAGGEMLNLAASVSERDLVIFVLSGGASALMESLVEGVALSDLQKINEILLASGARIGAMNLVRSRLSLIKGGGLAVAFCKATVCVLYMSDVEGDSPSVVGSGPFVTRFDPKGFNNACRAADLESHFPRIVELMRSNSFSRELVVSPPHRKVANAQWIRTKAGLLAKGLGLSYKFLAPMAGEARLYPNKGHLPSRRGYGSARATIAVGEAVVTKTGDGQGGRAQEMACVYAELIQGQDNIAVLVAGTDGTDGPTDAAGALVDGSTVERALSAGHSVQETLAGNDTYRFHEAAGTLVKTGPTGTNLNDILIVVRT